MFQTGVWFCYKCSRQVSGSVLDSILVLFLAFKVRRVCLGFTAEYWVLLKLIFSYKELWVTWAWYVMETSTKYNWYAARIPKRMGLVGVIGGLTFDAQGWWGPIGIYSDRHEKGGGHGGVKIGYVSWMSLMYGLILISKMAAVFFQKPAKNTQIRNFLWKLKSFCF